MLYAIWPNNIAADVLVPCVAKSAATMSMYCMCGLYGSLVSKMQDFGYFGVLACQGMMHVYVCWKDSVRKVCIFLIHLLFYLFIFAVCLNNQLTGRMIGRWNQILRDSYGVAMIRVWSAFQLLTEADFIIINTITHWGRDKIAAILKSTFWNTFSWMKIYEFWLVFHWSLFPRVQLTIFQHWFR